jgi:hypothetical protein
VNWPLELTVTPGVAGDANGNGSVRGVAVGAVGFAAAATIVFVFWLRRHKTLQEK